MGAGMKTWIHGLPVAKDDRNLKQLMSYCVCGIAELRQQQHHHRPRVEDILGPASGTNAQCGALDIYMYMCGPGAPKRRILVGREEGENLRL